MIQIHLLNIPLRVSVASKLATALQLSSPPLMCVFNSESALEMRTDHEQRLSCLMYWAFNEESLLDIGYNGLNLYTNSVESTAKPFILLQLSWWRNALLHYWPLLHSGTDCVLCTLSNPSRWASFISLIYFFNEQKNCTYPIKKVMWQVNEFLLCPRILSLPSTKRSVNIWVQHFFLWIQKYGLVNN